MTKLFSIVILYKGDPSAHILKAGHDLTSISYFQRSTAENFIMFTSKILVERTGLGARQSVKEAEYMCHVFVRSVLTLDVVMTSSNVPNLRSDKLSVVCVSDHEYPPRVAHTMMQRIGEDFAGEELNLKLRAGNTGNYLL